MLRSNVYTGLLLPLALAAFGCTAPPLTKMINLPPTNSPVAGQLTSVHKIAVMDINCPAPQMGEVMATTVSARLASTGRYQIAERPTIVQAGFNPDQADPSNLNADLAVQAGAKIGVDAVLVGEASFAPASKIPGIQDPQQKSLMTVNYRLIDTKTKSVLLTDQQTCVLDPAMATKPFNHPPSAPTADELRQSLADQFAAKVVTRLAAPSPRPMTSCEFAVDVLGLAKDTLISKGNRFAECGAFDEAARFYLQAAQENPQCHQALYNLGLLAERSGNLTVANQYYQSAMHLNDCRLYILAYQRTRSAQS